MTQLETVGTFRDESAVLTFDPPDQAAWFRSNLNTILRSLPVRICRIQIDCEFEEFDPSMLRSVFGMSLHKENLDVYHRVFDPESSRVRPYVIRERSDRVKGFEFLTFGDAVSHHDSLMDAWRKAGEAGFTANRKRYPFSLNTIELIDSDGYPCSHLMHAGVWTAHQAIPDDHCVDQHSACTVYAVSPVRILESQWKDQRNDRRLLRSPNLEDIAVAGIRRLCDLAGGSHVEKEQLAKVAALQASPSHFQTMLKHSLSRYSRTQNERMRIDGVVGRLQIPEGLGPLLPLMNALQWLHVGKSTVQGFGRILVRSMSNIPTTVNGQQ